MLLSTCEQLHLDQARFVWPRLATNHIQDHTGTREGAFGAQGPWSLAPQPEFLPRKSPSSQLAPRFEAHQIPSHFSTFSPFIDFSAHSEEKIEVALWGGGVVKAQGPQQAL